MPNSGTMIKDEPVAAVRAASRARNSGEIKLGVDEETKQIFALKSKRTGIPQSRLAKVGARLVNALSNDQLLKEAAKAAGK